MRVQKLCRKNCAGKFQFSESRIVQCNFAGPTVIAPQCAREVRMPDICVRTRCRGGGWTGPRQRIARGMPSPYFQATSCVGTVVMYSIMAAGGTRMSVGAYSRSL